MNPEMVFDKERIYEKIGGYDAEGGQPGGYGVDSQNPQENENVFGTRIYCNGMGEGDINGQNKKIFR